MIFVDEVHVIGFDSISTAALIVQDKSTIGELEVFAHSTATVSASVLTVKTLDLGTPTSPSGKLDLLDNGLIVDYTSSTPHDAIKSLITSGYAGGNWNGNGINSSTSATDGNTGIGYAEATEIFSSFPATFFGQNWSGTRTMAM